jgi:glutathione S-transferase
MSEITLYHYELDDSSYRVRLMLSMLGVDYTAYAVDMVPGNEQESPAMLALNPAGTLPVLKNGDLIVSGTEAILAYLAKAYDPQGKWLPDSTVAFAAVMQWLNFSASILPDAMMARKLCLFGLPGDEAKLVAASHRAFRIMDDHMTLRQIDGMEWFAGDCATIADVTLFPIFALSRDFGIDHNEFPALRRWIRRFRTLKGFKTMPGIPDYH